MSPITGERRERSSSSPGDGDRGVSPVVGVIILFGIVIIGATLLGVAGMQLMDGLQSSATGEHGDQVMQQVESDLLDQRGTLELSEHGDYNITEGGTISIVVENQFGETCPMADVTMGTLEYENDNGETVGMQAGGVFKLTGGNSVVQSEPDIRYSPVTENGDTIQRFDASLVNIDGTVDHGTNQVTYEPVKTEDCFDDIQFARNISIAVNETPYHDGWNSFFEKEFDSGDVTHYESDGNVTVHTELADARPFASFVNVMPTIYGGLYADQKNLTIDAGVDIDRYNGSVGYAATENKSGDLLVTNGNLTLDRDAVVNGTPVANEWLTGEGPDDIPTDEEPADVTGISYGTKFEGTFYETQGETELYNVTDTSPTAEVHGAKMSESFESIDAIDDEIADAISQLGADNTEDFEDSDTLKVLENGGYTENETIYYRDGDVDNNTIKIDTSGGDVHVAIDGNLTVDNFKVSGKNQTYFYVNGPEISAGEVDITDKPDRASALWIYGKSTADDVQVRDGFRGVLYAPGSEMDIDPSATIYGAVVGGELTNSLKDVTIHFDWTLRTDIPIPEENRDITIEDGGGDRPPYDVTFVLDRSGSMSDNDPKGLRASAAQDVIDIMDGEKGDQAGVYEFDDEGYETHHLSNDLSSVYDEVKAINGGNTDISAGMEPALNQYKTNGNENANRTMILLSDGSNTVDWVCTETIWGICTDGYYESNNRTVSQAKQAANMSVTIHTVGLGDSVDTQLLRDDIAHETGGNYYAADNASQLEEIFVEEIGKGMIEHNASSIKVSSFPEPNEVPNRHAIDVREQPVRIND